LTNNPKIIFLTLYNILLYAGQEDNAR